MSSLGTRASLTGSWATHWALILIFLPPTMLLIVFRESVLEPPTFAWSLASAVIQHAVVAVIVVGGGAIARRGRILLSLPLVISLWMLSAVARAIVGYVISTSAYAQASSILLDTVIWIAITATWVPITVYALAQFEHRRLLLTARDVAATALARERAAATESTQQLQARLLATVTAHLTPVLRDLEDSLDAARRRLGGGTSAELGMRISQLHDETADLVANSETRPAFPPSPGHGSRATFRRAFAINALPPTRSAGLVTLAALIAIAPDTLRVLGAPLAWGTVAAVAGAGILLGVTPGILARARRVHLTYLRAIVVSQGVAITAAIAIVAATPPPVIGTDAWILLPITAIAIATAHALYTSAFVVSDANRADDTALSTMAAETSMLATQRAERSRTARERMAQLMHGPIQGRLAACVMALNFHGDIATNDPERAELVLTAVFDHLHAVTVDLHRLGSETEALPNTP